jgi:hypothetical protein
MAFEIIFILGLIGLQIFVFWTVYKMIKSFGNFFPGTFSEIKIKSFYLKESILKNSNDLNEFLENLINYPDDFSQNLEEEGLDKIELLVFQSGEMHPQFTEVIKSTNAYLCKNKNSSADFGILKDTCERHVEKADNEIGNLINVPLYIGLAGTFIGIIVGLSGIDFSKSIGENSQLINPQEIGQLINGITAAMFASLIGLVFTVISTAILYKPAAFKNDTEKNEYYDFLQRELLPYLNIGVSKSLGNFKDVLNHFIKKFGENMDDYKDSGELLNENLQRQQIVLEEINKLSITSTAIQIAQTFNDLKESTEHLEKFREYQSGLNNYVDKTEKVSLEIMSVVDHFKDFNSNLKSISNHTLSSIELQKQFKDSLEAHFPTLDDHRLVWRNQVDELNEDIKEVYKELNNYFKTSTAQIQDFVGNNNEFFHGINAIQTAIQIFVENSNIQKEEFTVLKSEILELRKDYHDSQEQTIEMNIALIESIKDLKKAINKIEITKQ